MNWIQNGSWKTTSAGLLTILGGVTRLVFAIKAGNVTEEAIMTTLTAIVGGLGLMFARDNDKSSEQIQASKTPGNGSGISLFLMLGLVGALVGALVGGLAGCAAVKPGNDPLVVRTEQFLTTAQGTFLLTLQVDHADRGFWRTNAPAFHAFAEDLRTPTPYQITNTLPRYRVALLDVNDLKHDYQTGAANSNALATALLTLQSLHGKAGAWLNIVTNRP